MRSERRPRRRARACISAALILGITGALVALPAGAASAASGCALGPNGAIKHVIIVQFDNVHLERDNANVPSDIEQMPALYDFLTQNGTLLANDHTVLISHTADGILSTETGLYPDEFGGGVSNSFPYLNPNYSTSHPTNKVPGATTGSLFTYWTDTTSSSDPLYTLIHGAATSSDPEGINTPAPWVPFTRAGCDFAGIGSADMELENDTSDVADVYGSNSPQHQLGNWSYNTAYDQYFDAGSNLGTTDFEGLAIHCSQADSQAGGLCSSANGGAPDVLPDEPGGYSGYNALFGALAVNPALTGEPDQALAANYVPNGDTAPPAGNWQAPPIYDVFAPNATNTGPNAAPDPGNVDAETTPPPTSYTPGTTPTTEVLDSTGNPGFPGFDGMEANNALGYTAAAQEAGVPVTYTYISDVHDDQYGVNHGNAFGPGEAGEEAQDQEYNAAFSAFFQRLANDGINKSNTLFLFTVDEGDHYAGGAPLNANCDGVTTPCQYDTAEAGGAAYGTSGYTRNEGEADVNLPALIKGTTGISTTFGFDDDHAPAIIVPNQSNPAGTPPAQDSGVVRSLEREISATQEYDPITGQTIPITVNMADQTEEGILHMLNADPNRSPTFTLFGNDDFYFQGTCSSVGAAQGQTPAPVTNEGPGCPAQDYGFAWNHGDIQPAIASTWQGWVAPGIKTLGEDSRIWTDHTDIRPTLLTILGLKDDYNWDGRAISQIIEPRSGDLPWTITSDSEDFTKLANAYKQLNAPFGEFAQNTLDADTHALASNSRDDGLYTDEDAQLQACESQRQWLAAQMQSALQRAETGQRAVGWFGAERLTRQADELIFDSAELAHEADHGTVPRFRLCY